MSKNKKGSSCELPPNTTTTQAYNNSESSGKQPGTTVREPICSVFRAPVNNTSNYTNVSWAGLFDRLTGPPTILSDNTHKEKARNGEYFVRGLIDGTRNDENIGKCGLIILDVDTPMDGQPLSTPEKIHAAIQDITHVVHSSATTGRCRIIILVEPYEKEQTDELTYAAYQLCIKKGLKFEFAGESKTKSQPWFLPQTTDIDQHQAYGTAEGVLFSPDMVKNLNQLPDKKPPEPGTTTDDHNPLRDFIEDLDSGTIHEAAKKYAGWQRRTTNLSDKQIFDQLTLLIDLHCSDPNKVERWHESEREGLEDWFENNVDGEAVEFSSQDSVEDILKDYEVTEEYVDGLGEEKWLFPNLVIAGHILVIIAMPGGGKTSIFFYYVLAYMADQGAKVFYVDADSPATEHKAMKAHADEVGFTLINPYVNVGTGIDSFVKKLYAMVGSGVDLFGYVFVFDTLKKFTDLMNKSSVKEFFTLCRTMNSRGATCILLAHANKWRDNEDKLVPEGVGDVKNDTDDLIFFEREQKPNGVNVATIVDIDKGAKTRGIFEPISFHIAKSREVTMYGEALGLPDRSEAKAQKATDEEILDMAEGVLMEVGMPICKTELVNRVHAVLRGVAGEQRIKSVLTRNSCLKREGEKGRQRFEYSKGERNAQMFSTLP